MSTLLTEIDSSYVAQAALGHINGGVSRVTEQLKPKVYPDGDMWCALYGENIQEGVAGFGDTPAKALLDWEKNFYSQRLK